MSQGETLIPALTSGGLTANRIYAIKQRLFTGKWRVWAHAGRAHMPRPADFATEAEADYELPRMIQRVRSTLLVWC